MSLRHPLAKVKGLGSSGEGSHHWWSQRITALLLIPLTVWFMFSMVFHINDNLDDIHQWISQPVVSVLLLIYLPTMFYHAQLGLQVVIEDYIHAEGIKTIILLLSKAVLLLAAIASIFSVLRISL